jgi:hypothetical protein
MGTGGQTERTSVSIYRDTKERFDQAKPFDSMSADEFVEELLSHYEDASV